MIGPRTACKIKNISQILWHPPGCEGDGIQGQLDALSCAWEDGGGQELDEEQHQAHRQLHLHAGEDGCHGHHQHVGTHHHQELGQDEVPPRLPCSKSVHRRIGSLISQYVHDHT